MFLNLCTGTDLAPKPEIQRSIVNFPSGFESCIRIDPQLNAGKPVNEVTIIYRPSDHPDAFIIGQAVDCLRRQWVEKINLVLTFIPNARQDRVMVPGDSFSLKVFTDYINSLGLNRVVVFDPHSNVSTALINNCVVINGARFWQEVIPKEDTDAMLVAPDEGAYKKVYSLASGLRKPFVACSKIREPLTGQITGIEVNRDVKGKNLYILDDICDGGATFIILAKKLREMGAREINLVVSHGIFSKGLFPLYADGINNIYTTNSWIQEFETTEVGLDYIDHFVFKAAQYKDKIIKNLFHVTDITPLILEALHV